MADEEQRIVLTREERKRILDGNHKPIVRPEEPRFVVGSGCVLVWSHARRFSDDEGHVFKPPSMPLFAIKVSRIVRRKQGGWLVHFETTDRREVRRYMRRRMPAAIVNVTRQRINGEYVDRWLVSWGDRQRRFNTEDEANAFAEAKRQHFKERVPTATEIDKARREGAYTSDPSLAVDHLEAVSDEELKVMTDEARQVEAVRERNDIGAEIERIESLPIEQRLLELTRLARDRGIDPKPDLRALERRIQRRLGIAA